MERTKNTYSATLTLMSGTSVEITDSNQAMLAIKAVQKHETVVVKGDTICEYPYEKIESLCYTVTQSSEEYTDDTCESGGVKTS